MTHTLTFETTDREERGIAFAEAHPGDGPAKADEIMLAVLRERFEADAKQQDALDAAENHEAFARYADRAPQRAAFIGDILKQIEAQPDKESAVLPLVLQVGKLLGVEMPK